MSFSTNGWGISDRNLQGVIDWHENINARGNEVTNLLDFPRFIQVLVVAIGLPCYRSGWFVLKLQNEGRTITQYFGNDKMYLNYSDWLIQYWNELQKSKRGFDCSIFCGSIWYLGEMVWWNSLINETCTFATQNFTFILPGRVLWNRPNSTACSSQQHWIGELRRNITCSTTLFWERKFSMLQRINKRSFYYVLLFHYRSHIFQCF